MTQSHHLILVCGLPRSGTTYIGEVLSQLKDFHLVHEPLNKDFGVKGVPRWYPYLEEETNKNDHEAKELIYNIIHLNIGWTHSAAPESDLRTKLSKRIYGGRSGLKWGRLRLKKALRLPFQTVCLKDPFATFAADYFIKSLNTKVICMVKHPCALYFSYKRPDFKPRIKDLFDQTKLRSRYARDITPETWRLAERQLPVGVALLWKIMARMITTQSKKLKDLLVIRHEDLCLNPVQIMKNICSHLNLPYDNRINKYIHQTSTGHQILPRGKKLHSFKRNALVLKDAWQGTLDHHEEKTIQDVVGEDIYKIYEHW